MTPFELAGYTAETKFRIKEEEKENCEWALEHIDSLDAIFELSRDDKSPAPLFRVVGKPEQTVYLYTYRLEVVAGEEAKEELGSKYLRTIHTSKGSGQVDVYDVLEAFNVTCPAMQHALKKMLCAGLRGHKDQDSDKKEAIKSIERSIQLDKNREI